MSMSIKKLFSTKKAVVVGASVALTLGLSGAAYAYFGSAGSGSGTASVGSTSALIITSDVPAVIPGGPAAGMNVYVNNPGPGSAYVGTITGTVANNANGCLGSWFTITPITENASLAAGTTTLFTAMVLTDAGPTINQTMCEGATMTINWTSN